MTRRLRYTRSWRDENKPDPRPLDDVFAELERYWHPTFEAKGDELEAQAKAAHEAEADMLERERISNRRRILLDMGVSRTEHLDPAPVDTPAVIMLRNALRNLRKRSQRRGAVLCLSGGNGVGKSFAAILWLLTARERPWYATAHQLVAFRGSPTRRAPDWHAGGAYVLDQVGHEFRSDKLDELVHFVLNRGRILVMTTDITSEAFTERYGGHVISRVGMRIPNMPAGGWLAVDGKDWRSG